MMTSRCRSVRRAWRQCWETTRRLWVRVCVRGVQVRTGHRIAARCQSQTLQRGVYISTGHRIAVSQASTRHHIGQYQTSHRTI
eukprot:1838750-Rhodomonas_salina.1